jgi:hypothetical protein
MNKIRVAQLAKIPCANSGLELSNFLNQHSDKYECRYILGSEYSKGCNTIPFRAFPTDLNWKTQREECLKIISEADIIHVHHDFYFEEVAHLLVGKKVIVTLYNLSNALQYENNDFNRKYIARMKKYATIITIADQPLQKKMFSDISTLIVPLVKNLYNEVPKKVNITPHIVFAPTNRDSTGIGRKMYYEVLAIIDRLKKEYKFTFDLIEGVPYEENLDRKRLADIIIDDVDPTYEKAHNTSYEAAFFGAIPLTNYSSKEYPFYKTDIKTLENTLTHFLTNSEDLKNEQKKIFEWIKTDYTPENILKIYDRIYSIQNKNVSVDLPDLTIFLITCGENPNYPHCVEALQNQTCTFNLEVIRDVSPMAKAFQQMLDKCKTPYYIQVDEDMILKENAIITMYKDIKIASKNTAMIVYRLHDQHLNFNIQGVKIYKHEIFKQYPYNLNTLSCEMEQLNKMKNSGYIYQENNTVLGEHSPYWNNELIFDRYFIFMQKHDFKYLPAQTFETYRNNPTQLNWYALLGSICGTLIKDMKRDKAFDEKNPAYVKLNEYFKTIEFKIEEKPKVIIDSWLEKLNQIQKLNIKFWYLKKTCLYMVNRIKKSPEVITIGVRNEEDKEKILSLGLGEIEIIVDLKQNIKPWNENAGVPSPVVTYLTNMFGSGWKELTS